MTANSDKNNSAPAWTDNLLPAAVAALLLACSLLIPAVALYCYNSSEFTFRLSELLPKCALAFAVLALLFFLLLFFLRHTRLFPWMSAGMLALSIAVWLQHVYLADALATYQTSLDEFSWLTVAVGAINFVAFSLPFAVCLRYRHWCCRHYMQLAIVVLLPQLLPLLFRLTNYTQPQYDFYEYNITEQDKCTFARQRNVLVIVVDCLGEYLFKELWREYPEMRASFRDFTCFDQMLSPKPSTNLAVPAILTGHEYPGSYQNVDGNLHAQYLQQSCHSPESLLVNFKREGYRCEGYPFILQTISYSPALLDNVSPRTDNRDSHQLYLDILYQRLTPFFCQPLLNRGFMTATDPFLTPREETPLNQTELPQDLLFYRQLKRDSKIGNFDFGFKYIHFQGGHAAITLNEKLEITSHTDVKKQMRASFSVLESLLQKLQQLGVYEQSLIVITGDHSERYTPEIVTLIKRPGDTHPATEFNSVPCTITDIHATVLAESSLAAKSRSLFSRPAVQGSGDLSRSVRPQTLDLGNFLPCPGNAAEMPDCDWMFSQPYEIERLSLAVKQDLDMQKNTFMVSLLAYDLQSRKCWQTRPQIAGGQYGQPYSYQSSLLDLPVGNYQLFLNETICTQAPDANEEDDFLATIFPPTQADNQHYPDMRYFPQFLVRSQTDAFWSSEYPGIVPRPMQKGETILFQPMQPYPCLQLPKDLFISGKGLRLTENSVLGVLLPSAEPSLHLRLLLNFPVPFAAVFEVFHDDMILYRQEFEARINKNIPLRLALPPEIITSGTLNLQCRLRKKYPNRDRDMLPKFHLQSLTLEE